MGVCPCSPQDRGSCGVPNPPRSPETPRCFPSCPWTGMGAAQYDRALLATFCGLVCSCSTGLCGFGGTIIFHMLWALLGMAGVEQTGDVRTATAALAFQEICGLVREAPHLFLACSFHDPLASPLTWPAADLPCPALSFVDPARSVQLPVCTSFGGPPRAENGSAPGWTYGTGFTRH